MVTRQFIEKIFNSEISRNKKYYFILVFYNGTITDEIFLNKMINEGFLHHMSNYEPQIIMAEKSMLSGYAIYYPSTLNFVQPIIEEVNKLNISKENTSLTESGIIVAETIIKLVHQLKNPYINYS